ncbi:hypothetical protein BGZ97_010901, partial [Linnemannia gamsii]
MIKTIAIATTNIENLYAQSLPAGVKIGVIGLRAMSVILMGSFMGIMGGGRPL